MPDYEPTPRETALAAAEQRSAEAAKSAYLRQLAQEGRSSATGSLAEKTARIMGEETARLPVRVLDPEAPTLVWSDLHLGHAGIIALCGRPFADRAEMDRALEAAARAAGPEDVVINCGDLHLGGKATGRAIARYAAAAALRPGRHVLLAGNHDFGRNGAVCWRNAGAVSMCAVMRARHVTLVFTHVPIRSGLPRNFVNVHGHTHANEPPDDSRINVCVEHTGYRPLPIGPVIRLAERIAAGDAPAGDTTAERIAALDRATAGRV